MILVIHDTVCYTLLLFTCVGSLAVGKLVAGALAGGSMEVDGFTLEDCICIIAINSELMFAIQIHLNLLRSWWFGL
jgi:hypothetical protein